MKKLIYIAITFCICNLNLYSDPLTDLLNESAFGINSGTPTPPPFCGIGWGTSPANQVPDISSVGDSRSFLLALAEMNGDSSISPQSIDENRSNRLLRLSTEEIQSRNEHITELSKEGLDYRTAIYEMTQMLKQLHQNSYAETGQSAETYLLEVTQERIQDISELSPEMLLKSRQVLSIQIKNRKFILNEYKNEFDSDFLRFLKAELNLLIQYRREIIDRMSL